MESFDFDNNVMIKADDQKWSFMQRFCGLREIKKLFRIAEIFLALVFLIWASRRLPFAVRISGEYLRQLLNVVVSNLFVFFLGNIIVLILFFKSRNLFLHHRETASSELCHELIGDSYDSTHFAGESCGQAEEIVYQDKQTILEVTNVKVHRRSLSANFRREKLLEEDHGSGGCGKQLRRSETERPRRVAAPEMVEELSNEEFQEAIDAFIAKQVKFHQQEKLAIVLHGSM